MGSICSQPKPISGAPQGCVLGPILFIIYTTDFISAFPCKTCVNADDTKANI